MAAAPSTAKASTDALPKSTFVGIIHAMAGTPARPFWTAEDIQRWIAESTADDWEVAPAPQAPTFELGSLMLERPGSRPHEWTAVYLPHEQLRVAWGRETGRAYEPEWQPPQWGAAQPKVAEVVWKGTIERSGTVIERYGYAAVDAGRCYLPSPRRARASEHEWRWSITRYEYTLFRLVNELSGPSGSRETFDAHLREAAINVED
jgi:hypothetical protein